MKFKRRVIRVLISRNFFDSPRNGPLWRCKV
jgi:hypothetical protein